MPFLVLPLTLAFGTQLSYECDVRTLEQQKDPTLIQSRVIPGLNSVKVSVNVNQIVDNGATIQAFLDGRRGTAPFTLTNPPPELVGITLRCKEYTINYVGQTNGIIWHQLSATFVETKRAIL